MVKEKERIFKEDEIMFGLWCRTLEEKLTEKEWRVFRGF